MRSQMRLIRLSLVLVFLLDLLLVQLPKASLAETGPRNIILLIGDGMGFEQVKAAGIYQSGAAGTLAFEQLPYTADMTTYSANASVTDSAAAASAMATGVKVNNGVISMAIPGDGTELETSLEFFQDRCKSVGLVTSVYSTHATPAGFGAHETSRSNYTQIADDYYYQTRPNVNMGGGGNGQSPSEAQSAGYAVVANRAEMEAIDTEIETMLSGQFSNGAFAYEYDPGSYFDTYPHLSEVTTTSLQVLDNDPDGFFLMIEAGLIDWAGHDNLLPENIYETLELDQAFQVVWSWAQGRTDTLIIVTADHETGGLTVLQNNGLGEFPTVTWSTTGHTSANVPVYAWGPNAEMVTGTIDNTDIFHITTANAAPPDCGPVPTASPTAPPEGVLDLQISSGTDDAEEQLSSGIMYLDSSDLELTDDSGYNGEQIVGLRFSGVAVPRGATIDSAYIEFTVDETDSIATSLEIHGQADDTAATFSPVDHDISSRPVTGASVAWSDVPPWTTVGQIFQTPDLSPVVQEIVDRTNWSSGNALAFMITGSGERTAEAFEGVPSAAPLLHIEYSHGATATPSDTPIPPTPSPTATDTPIPPSCTSIEAGMDSYLKEDRPTENKGDDDELRVKTQSGKQQRPVLWFDLSTLPPGANIQSASMSLWLTSVKNGPVDVHAYGLLQSWSELGTTWLHRDISSGLAWQAPGGTYSATAIDSASVAGPTSSWVSWDLLPAVAGWHSGDNLGVILSSPVNGTTRELKFRSRERSTAAERPKLDICYYEGPPPTPTNTPIPPTPTDTSLPPTPSNTPTDTPIPPTPTNTPIAPTPTSTPISPICTLLQPGPEGMDAYLKEDKQDDRKGDDSELRVKTEKDKLQRSLLQFDLSGVPQSATVESVTLSLWVKDLRTGPVSVAAHRLTEPWNEPQVTWSDRDRAAALSWTLAGGTYDPTAVDVTTISQEDVWANWDLTPLGVHWLTVDNYGLILEAPATIPKSEVKFRSSDDGSSEQRPRLQVCYWP